MDIGELRRLLAAGLAIPAHPLALTAAQEAGREAPARLTRYYLDAGAGGIAVGVHTTQFAIRSPEHGLFSPVLEMAAEEAAAFEKRTGKKVVKIAGAVGPTAQALAEAETARRIGYDAVLLGLGWARGKSWQELASHCRRGGEGPPALRLLPPARRGRHPACPWFLEALPGDRERGGNQGRALQPLPDDRRGAGPGRIGARRGGRSLHGKRRRHRGRPAHPVPFRRGRAQGRGRGSAAGSWATGRSGRARR